MTNSRVLACCLRPDENSFTLVRLVAALSVVVSHAFLLAAGTDRAEPLGVLTPFTLGQHAVNIFFLISGLTVAQSIERAPILRMYVWARFLRIFPGLFAFGVLFAFVAGPLLTTLPILEYFSDAHTWMYPFAVLGQFARAEPPHEIFMTSPLAGAINTPLWTIKYEIFAYIILGCVVWGGRFRRPVNTAILVLCFAGLLIVARLIQPAEQDVGTLYQFGRFGFSFWIGVLAYRLRDNVPLSPWLLLITLGFTATSTPGLRDIAYIVFTGHLAIIVGTLRFGALSAMAQRNDVSYGVYIYSWPLQQTLITSVPTMGVVALLTASIAGAIILGYLSWRLIEQPVLAWKRIDPLTWRASKPKRLYSPGDMVSVKQNRTA